MKTPPPCFRFAVMFHVCLPCLLSWSCSISALIGLRCGSFNFTAQQMRKRECESTDSPTPPNSFNTSQQKQNNHRKQDNRRRADVVRLCYYIPRQNKETEQNHRRERKEYRDDWKQIERRPNNDKRTRRRTQQPGPEPVAQSRKRMRARTAKENTPTGMRSVANSIGKRTEDKKKETPFSSVQKKRTREKMSKMHEEPNVTNRTATNANE